MSTATSNITSTKPAQAANIAGVWPAGEANRCLHEHFFHHGLIDPTRKAVVWLGDNGGEQGVRTYADLAARARAVAFRLTTKYGVKPGDCVVLVLPPGLAFLDAFFGCLVAGAVAVPVYPPNPATIEKDLERLNKIVKVANVKVALTSSEFRTRLYLAKTAMMFSKTFNAVWPKELSWQTIDGMAPAPKTFVPTPSSGDDVAFLQFTSGSTSDPKGVMITHNNVLHNINCMFQLQTSCLELGTLVCVNWMPQYHDMGLINMTMATLLNGGTLYNMSPITFLKNPLVWLEALSKYKASLTGGPNFSLVRVVKAYKALPVEKRPQLDLSSMTTLVCGAEPIALSTLDDFVDMFGAHGFPRHAMWPAYGLAEHTVFACAQKEEYFADELGNVCCGKPLPEVAYRIVDPETCVEVGEGMVGEIWISSGSKALGYWGQEEVSKETFQAHLVGSSMEFLRTGDLGYMRDGALFVKGRCKDVIIVAGRNYYPQDVELTVQECSEAIRPGCIAAFTLPYGDEAAAGDAEEGYLGIVAEVREPKMNASQADELMNTIRDAVQQGHAPLQPIKIILVQPRTIPKTTSGKIRRAECKSRAISGINLATLPYGTWTQTPGQAKSQPEFEVLPIAA